MENTFHFETKHFPENIEIDKGTFVWTNFSQIGGVFANGIYLAESARLPAQKGNTQNWSEYLGILRMAYVENPTPLRVKNFKGILDLTSYTSSRERKMGRVSYANIPYVDLIETMLINKGLHWIIESFHELQFERDVTLTNPNIVAMFFTGIVNLKKSMTGRRVVLQEHP